MKYTGPKVRLSRRLGVAITPKAIRYMEKRPYPPGQHGQNKHKRRAKSVYGEQLLEKQKLRFQYNISERQLRNYFQKAQRKKGKTGEVLIQNLETRLDAIVLRAGFARTIYASRQYVAHGHILVNDQKVDIPSYGLKIGDVIKVREKNQNMAPIQEAMRTVVESLDYVERDWVNMRATLKYIPSREEIPVICEVDKIVEFYSR